MIEQLAKKDIKWREQAYLICNDRVLADDLVQDMYIYFSDKNYKVNDYYVIKKLYGLFIDFIRKEKKKVSIELIYHLEDLSKSFEPDDKESCAINTYKNLNRIQKELITEHFINGKSLRQIQKEYPLINYGYAFRQIREAKEINTRKEAREEAIKKANEIFNNR